VRAQREFGRQHSIQQHQGQNLSVALAFKTKKT
jgi:hypothetical protein